jgi:hypothetical protein
MTILLKNAVEKRRKNAKQTFNSFFGCQIQHFWFHFVSFFTLIIFRIKLPDFKRHNIVIVCQVSSGAREAYVKTSWKFYSVNFKAGLFEIASSIWIDFDCQPVFEISKKRINK